MDVEKVENSKPKERFDSSSGLTLYFGGKSENAPNTLIVALMLGFLSAHVLKGT